jgi:hypothetical protein
MVISALVVAILHAELADRESPGKVAEKILKERPTYLMDSTSR